MTSAQREVKKYPKFANKQYIKYGQRGVLRTSYMEAPYPVAAEAVDGRAAGLCAAGRAVFQPLAFSLAFSLTSSLSVSSLVRSQPDSLLYY